MTEIEELVNELQDEIESTDEYSDLRDAEEAYENDSEAQDLLVQIRQTENKIRAAHNSDEEHEEDHEELHRDLKELQQELDGLEVVQQYYEAAEDLQERLDSDVNQHLDGFELTV